MNQWNITLQLSIDFHLTTVNLPPYAHVFIPKLSISPGKSFVLKLDPETFVDPHGDDLVYFS